MKATPRCQQVVKRGADCEWFRSLLRLAQFIQVPIRRLGVENRLKSEQTKVGGEKIALKRSSADSDSMRQVGV